MDPLSQLDEPLFEASSGRLRSMSNLLLILWGIPYGH
jgi:hypothetical protein